LKEQIEFEENYIKQKNQSLKKVKGKIKWIKLRWFIAV
jgi:hypothetical protein